MHDRPRIIKTLDPAAQALEAEKITKYKELLAHCHAINQSFSSTTSNNMESDFADITRVLQVNPEAYTFYNLRRKILLALIAQYYDTQSSKKKCENEQTVENDSTTETPAKYKRKLLFSEFEFVTQQLKKDYKSYCTWHHRKWIFSEIDDEADRRALLQKDLAHCEYLLTIDERNFHCWGYRRWLKNELATTYTDKDELQFVSSKIGNSFSNYSAWHSRVAVMQNQFQTVVVVEGACSPSTSSFTIEKSREEVSYILQAFFCDPCDSSAFLYMEWFLLHVPCENEGIRRELVAQVMTACEELLQLEGDSKWPLWMILQCSRQMKNEEQPIIKPSKDLLNRLLKIDTKHSAYYEDMARAL